MGSLLGSGSGPSRQRLTGLINQERASDRMFGESARAQLLSGLKATLGGYDAALDKTSAVSRTARRQSIQAGQRYEGELTQRYGAGGKFATTALDQARMGLQSSLTEDLSAIDSQFAGLFSELSIGRGRAEAQGRAGIAGLDMARSEQESELYRLLAGTVKPQTPGMASDIFGLVGAGVGAVYGGPTGAAIGGEAGNQLGGMFERD